MTPTNTSLVKYIGAMFNVVPGGFMGALGGLLTDYGGNMVGLMHDLSNTGVFRMRLAPGTDRDVAADLVNRLVGDTVRSTDKAWAVDWFTGMKAAGISWGEILYTAISALDQITTGPWAAAGDQLRARTAYAVEASETWAASTTDLATLGDVYSYGIASVHTTWHGEPVLVPLTRLAEANSALATAVADLGGQAGDQSYTIGTADTGKAIMMGAGNDTVSVTYADLVKPAFVSGGDGSDTLIVHGAAAGYADFMNGYQGVMSNLPYRGFEKIVFQDFNPYVVGSIDGVKEYSFSGNLTGVDVRFGSVDNGTVFNLVGIKNGLVAKLHFSEFPPFNDIDFLNASPGAQASPPQLVDSLTFNVDAAGGGLLLLPNVPAKHVTLNVQDSAGAASTFMSQFNELGAFGGSAPSLESFTLASNVNSWFSLTAPLLKNLDFSGSTGRVEMYLFSSGSTLNDGIVDAISVSAPQGLFALNWAAPSSATDSYFAFNGEYKAGSSINVGYQVGSKAASMPTTKMVFNSDFSELGYYNSQEFGPLGNTKVAGSLFDVNGVQNAAVYFKGVAAPGQTIGTVVIDGAFQSTTVKVDSANGIQVLTHGGSAVTTFINSGAGSVLDALKASVSAQLTQPLTEVIVGGGKILWSDTNGNGQLDGMIYPAESFAPWVHGPDFVMFETTSANLSQFSQAVQLLGFNPVVDPFL